MRSSEAKRILFITRRYPPSIGGIQTHCYQLYTHLSTTNPVKLVALRQNHLIHLAWFIPYAFVVSLFQVLFRRVDAIYFSDGVVCCLAPFLRVLSTARFVVTIYGLELTYSHPIFSLLMKRGIARCDSVVVISQETQRIAVDSGVPAEKVLISYVGIEPPSLAPDRLETVKAAFEEEHGIRFGEDRILLNLCRQVERKGLAVFLEKGMPLVSEDIKLLIGGRGPELDRLHRLRESLGLQDRVVLLGWLEDDVAAMLRNEADLFVMPNIRIEGDVEGFGMAQLECMHAGMPAVVFAVDALVESVREGGYLIQEADYQAFADAIHGYFSLSPDGRQAAREKASAYVRREYSWRKTTEEYLRVLEGASS
jgi:glycosyltransferase involved in cell wall biosynthesis